MGYNGFISYSHAADDRMAPALQRGLQRLAKKWNSRRALHVFRDETGLSTNPHLWSAIETALDDSDWFVLLASPESAASEWVNKEVAHWVATKPVDHILPVVTDGTWEWDASTGDFTADSTSVPPALRGALTAECRHLDLRWARDETDLDLRNSRFRAAIADLAAPMHGIAKDDLEGEDIRQQRRSRRLARGATSMLVLLLAMALALGGLAWQQRGQARGAARDARRDAEAIKRKEAAVLSYGLAGASIAALHAGRTDLAALLSVEAVRTRSTPQSESSLLNALVNQPTLVAELYGLSKSTTPLGFSPDGHLFAATDGSRVRIWDLRNGQLISHQPSATDGEFADNGQLFVGTSICGHPKCGLDVWDLTNGHVVRHLNGIAPKWATSAASAELADASVGGKLDVWNLRSGARTMTVSSGQAPGNFGFYDSARLSQVLALSPDGLTVALITTTASVQIRAWNAETGRAAGPGCTIPPPPASDLGYDAVQSFDVLSDDTTARMALSIPLNTTPALLERCDLATGRSQTRGLSYKSSAEVAGVSPTGQLAATREGGVGANGAIQLVRTSNGSPVGGPVRAPYGGWMISMAGTVKFSPDGRYFAASEYDGDVRIWRTAPQTMLQSSVDQLAQNPNVTQFVSSPGRSVGVTEAGDVIDARTDRTLTHLVDFVPYNNADPNAATTVGVSTDGDLIGALTGTSLTVVDLERDTTRTEHFASTCPARLGELALTKSLAVFSCLEPNANFAYSLQPVDLSASPWKVLPTIKVNPEPQLLTFSPDGRALAVIGTEGCCGGFRLIQVNGTRLRLGVGIYQRDTSGAFTPDSRSYLLEREDGEVDRLTTGSLGRKSTVVAQPSSGVEGVIGESADGSILATDGPGNAIGLWDLNARQLLTTVPFQDFAGDPGDAVNDFDFQPAAWERDACTIANRNLTRSEWAQYLPGVPYHKTCPSLP